MKIYVVFDMPGIDPDDDEVDNIVEVLEESLGELGGYSWHIDEIGDDDEN